MKEVRIRAAALLTSPFDSAHPIRSLVRIYLFANFMGFAITFGLGAPSATTDAARAAFAWCGIS